MQKLNNNTLALQALLTKVNNLPEGGSSGGGASVETCTVTFTGMYINMASATVVNANTGAIECITPEGYDVTIENVLCGSCVTAYPSGAGINFNITGDMVMLDSYMVYAFSAPTEAGASATVRFYSDF